jgi:hypothetical protein
MQYWQTSLLLGGGPQQLDSYAFSGISRIVLAGLPFPDKVGMGSEMESFPESFRLMSTKSLSRMDSRRGPIVIAERILRFKFWCGVAMEDRLVTVETQKICVLYDPMEGRVVHTHMVVSLPGGRAFSDDEVEARARERASDAGLDVDGLRALKVAADAYDNSEVYVVDTATAQLRKLERPKVDRIR